MAVASWMLKNRNLSSSYHRRSAHDENNVSLDLLRKNPGQNITEILTNICQTEGISEGKVLNYLNAFVKLTLHINGNFEDFGYTIEEILCCLRIALVHESTHVRSAGLRAIRHVLRSEDDVNELNRMMVPYLIARSLNLTLNNNIERIEALKLVRKILMVSSSHFDMSIARSLVSSANAGVEGGGGAMSSGTSGMEEKDRMLRVCLAALSELGTLNPEVFIASGGVAALTRNLMECQTPRIAEALCGVLLLLLDRPKTRCLAAIDLHCVAAPYCDFHYRHGWMDKNRDERELRFNCSRLALLTLLRSWPGILHFCSPNDISGLRAIVDVLYLNQLEVRKAVLVLLYDLLGMPQPEWTDELVVAFSTVDPSEPQAAWRLNEGFVAAEGRSILPHLAKTVPSISDMHLSLLLYCFIENGLLEALCEVITTSDTFISVRATVLLGELLRLIQILLPPECCNITPPLRSLLVSATKNNPQALRAISALQQQHKLLKKRPASYSLYLDHILQSGHFMKMSSRSEKVKKTKLSAAKTKLQQFVSKDDDLIKDTGVLLNQDAFTWNWNLIRVIVKHNGLQILDMNESVHRRFLERLVEFYMPSSHRYSHMDLTTPKVTQGYTMVGIELIKLLLDMANPDTMRLLLNLFTDIRKHISAITYGKSAHDCLFSPLHMANTQCQSYFLFIGRLGSTREGVSVLEDLNIFHELRILVARTKLDCYIKLIISSLDYRESGPARELLSTVLTCSEESFRLYATQFLLVLLRAGLPNFSNWGVRLIVNQLNDKSRLVCFTALTILQEAAEVPECLEHLVKFNPDLLHLGERGLLLLIRYLSIDSGFALLNKNDFIVNEINRWDEFMNYRYVKIVEGDTADVLTLHQRGDDGRYHKRESSIKSTNRKELFLPPHLYGQVARHPSGYQLLLQLGSLETYINCLELGSCITDQDVSNLKAALWAVAHFGSTPKGIEYLVYRGSIASMVQLAQTCPVYSIRATAFYCLGLVATTRLGADCLFKLGWVCTRHDRHDKWPIIEEENWEDERLDDQPRSTHIGSDSERTSSDHPFIGDCSFVIADDSTTDDELMYIENSGPTAVPQQKSLTLPASQTPLATQHKRSLSESKTFEIIKSHEQKYKDRLDIRLSSDASQRHRNNSTTESTTSGVSSCDSMVGKSVINERQQTLSPIPSSSSLSTIRQAGVKIRRHSESSKRGPDRPTVSPAGSSGSRLSYQDRIGYATVRSLRRQPPVEEFSDMLPSSYNPKSHFLFMKTRQHLLSDCERGEGSITSELSLTSLSSVHKFSVKDTVKSKGQCYMGICLPQVLTDLFSDDERDQILTYKFNSLKLVDGTASNTSLSAGGYKSESIERKKPLRHESRTCLNCCRVRKKNNKKLGATSVEDNEHIKKDILMQVERLSNPLWIRQSMPALFHYKQRNPAVFQDVCLFSEVCKLLSENTYRLGPRRVLYELFLDVNYSEFYVEPQAMLSKERTEGISRISVPIKEKQANSHLVNQQRKVELQGSLKVIGKSTSKGFYTDASPDGGGDRFSPTRHEAKSPPLSSVKEELASNENLLASEEAKTQDMQESSECNSEGVAMSIRTLESLKFTYKENKFPITNRDKC